MKTRVLGIAIMLMLGLCAGHAQSDSVFDAITFRGIQDVYNLEFEKAEAEFKQLVAMRPEHPAGHFFLGMVTWWLESGMPYPPEEMAIMFRKLFFLGAPQAMGIPQPKGGV